jgi:hypothetical protein
MSSKIGFIWMRKLIDHRLVPLQPRFRLKSIGIEKGRPFSPDPKTH